MQCRLGCRRGVIAEAGIFFFTGDHCGDLQVTSSFVTNGHIDAFGVGWGTAREVITLRTGIYGFTEGAWLVDTGFDIANLWEVIGMGSADFNNQPNTVFAHTDVKSNRTYFIHAETAMEVDVGGGAGGNSSVAISLTNIEACL